MNRGALFWVFLAVTLANYLIMVLWSLPRLAEAAGGLQPFDLRPAGYSAEEARAFLAALGEDGRRFYISVQHRLDAAYPALMAVTLVLAFSLLLSRRLAILPSAAAVLAAVFDYLENRAVDGLLMADPAAVSDAAIAAASRWTLLKGAFSTMAFVCLLLAVGAALWQRLRGAR